MVEEVKSYEMVRNYNNFKAFVVFAGFFFTFAPPPPNLYDLVKILGIVGQSTTTPPPPPPMLMASRRPCVETEL